MKVMTMRAGMTGLVVALIFASPAWPGMSAPRAADDAQNVDKAQATIATSAEKALEQQGGSRIVFKVDADALHEEMVTALRDDVVRILREGRIPFADLAINQGGVDVRIEDARYRQRVLGKLAPSGEAPRPPTVDVADSGDGLMRLTPAEQAFAERRRELVKQSMEMIDQRLRNSGIVQPGLEPDGSDRIRVVLPGVSDPGRVAAMFSKQAHLAFRLVDVSMSPEQALQGAAPPASEVLYDYKTSEPYLIQKDIAVEGEDIIDASPIFASDKQPVAFFRFNAHGTRRFAHITEDNVGRPFAIVLDDRVLSVSVIQEPITGGSGQISGNFNLTEANTIAMLLRSGTLPGRLSVVDQQVVEPAGNAAKP
jgi:preprotein translocase subunit SecD